MANHVFVAMSLDGYIADANKSVDWLNAYPQGDGAHFSAFMKSMDVLIMGRCTFEAVHSFGQWPYTIPTLVMSKSLTSLPDGYEDKAEVFNGSIEDVMQKMKDLGYEQAYVDGGRLVQSFMEKELIDSLTLTHVPIVLGDGVPLFAKRKTAMRFEHVHTEVLTSGMVMSGYIKKA